MFDAVDERERLAQALRRQREEQRTITNEVGDPLVFNAERVEAEADHAAPPVPQQVERGHWEYRGYKIDLLPDGYSLWAISHPEKELPPELQCKFTGVRQARLAIDLFEARSSAT
jgi:hypothetical protein